LQRNHHDHDTNRASRLRAGMFNLPNQLTFLRLLLSVVLFCFVAAEYYLTSMVLFIIAAGTDWLDATSPENTAR